MRRIIVARVNPLLCAVLSFSLLLALQTGCNKSQSKIANEAQSASSPVASSPSAKAMPPSNPLKNAYFGDLHLHTGYSMDAFAFGTRTTPEDSYKYAMGETVEYIGKPQKRIAPLDFLAVTDHAEYLGVVRDTIDPNGPFAKSEWYTVMTSSDPKVSGEAFKKLIGSRSLTNLCRSSSDPKLLRSTWEKYAAIADKYNAREIHLVHRVRMDVDAAVSEPASMCDLRRQGAGHALHGIRLVGSGRSLAVS